MTKPPKPPPGYVTAFYNLPTKDWEYSCRISDCQTTRRCLPNEGWTNLKSHLVSDHPGWEVELKKLDGQAEITFKSNKK